MIIGVDPHKGSHTATAVSPTMNAPAGSLRVDATLAGYRQLLRWGKAFRERQWAIENAHGLGQHLAQWLIARGETVVDVRTTATARVRELSRGGRRKNDVLDAAAAASVAAAQGDASPIRAEDDTTVFALLGRTPCQPGCQQGQARQPAPRPSAGYDPPRGQAGAHGRGGDGTAAGPSTRLGCGSEHARNSPASWSKRSAPSMLDWSRLPGGWPRRFRARGTRLLEVGGCWPGARRAAARPDGTSGAVPQCRGVRELSLGSLPSRWPAAIGLATGSLGVATGSSTPHCIWSRSPRYGCRTASGAATTTAR